MAKINDLLMQLKDVSDNPKSMLKKYVDAGKKVIGCFPIYTPAEIVHASGMIPMGIWGGQVNPSVAGQYAPIFICSIMRSSLEFGMLGKYNGVSAVIMPILCDTFRGMSGAWRTGVKGIPLIGVIQPQNREVKGATEFLAAEYDEVRKQLEKIAGHPITDAEIEKSIDLYNEHGKTMMQFTKVANKHLDVITPKLRHAVMKSAHFMEKAEHMAIVKDIIAELNTLPECDWKGKKVIVTGITAEPDEILDIFAENNIAIVGDDLAQESRQFRTLIPAGETPLMRLAKQWDERKACSTVHEINNTRGQMLTDMAKAEQADGIITCLMSFCDVEEYEYPMIVKAAEKESIATLCLDIDQSTQNSGQSRTKLQTFVEMI